jgi:hypothetical protein
MKLGLAGESVRLKSSSPTFTLAALHGPTTLAI